MKITVAVILCHALAPITAPVCREEVVVQKGYVDAGLHDGTARNCGMEKPFDLSRRSMAGDAVQVCAGRLRAERSDLMGQVILFKPYYDRRNALVFDPLGHARLVTTFWLALIVGMAAVAVLEWE